MTDPIKRTLVARVYDVAKETPLDFAPQLTSRNNTNIYLKREDLQTVHSFKIRGAYNKLYNLSSSEKQRGIIAASAGNHAQGVALSANKLNLSALIVMPLTTPDIKVKSVKEYGAEIILYGDSYSDAYEHAMKIVRDTGRTFIHPFDDPFVIAGQGTIGREIIEQLPELTHVFVPVGGGGLIAGVAQFIKSVLPEAKIVGVEPEDSNAMSQSLALNKIIELGDVGIFADGVAVKRVGEITYEIAKKYVDDIITVSTDLICAAIKDIFEETRSIMEPAGALALAGVNFYNLKSTDKVVAICSGANMTFERLQQVAERTLIGSGKEALYAIKMPEKPGALLYFCEKIINGHSITEFNYRLHKRSVANVMVGLTTATPEDKSLFESKMDKFKFQHEDLTNDEIAKEHTRHMIGGQSVEAKNEYFYQIYFPERPGALTRFLSSLGDDMNISAFHYRNTASDKGNVLIGIEADSKSELESRLDKIDYSFNEIDDSLSLQLFIK